MIESRRLSNFIGWLRCKTERFEGWLECVQSRVTPPEEGGFTDEHTRRYMGMVAAHLAHHNPFVNLLEDGTPPSKS